MCEFVSIHLVQLINRSSFSNRSASDENALKLEHQSSQIILSAKLVSSHLSFAFPHPYKGKINATTSVSSKSNDLSSQGRISRRAVLISVTCFRLFPSTSSHMYPPLTARNLSGTFLQPASTSGATTKETHYRRAELLERDLHARHGIRRAFSRVA